MYHSSEYGPHKILCMGCGKEEEKRENEKGCNVNLWEKSELQPDIIKAQQEVWGK